MSPGSRHSLLSAELFEALITAAGDGLVAIDALGRVVVFNAAAGRIFGLDPEEILGHTLERLFPPGSYDTHRQSVLRYFAGQGAGVVGTTTAAEGWHSSGHPVPIEISLSAAEVGGEKLALASIRDITPRVEADARNRELMRQLTQAHKMEAVGTLAAGIAHDFNSNLQTILGYASALAKDLGKDSRYARDVQQILGAVNQARELTEKLLGFSREAEQQMEVLSVNRVVRDAVGLLRRTIPPSVTVRTHLAREVYTEGDPTLLQQCLMNICINARDAMPDGGELLLSTALEDLDGPAAQNLGLSPGPYCVIVARDSGVGMSSEVLERVFDPFFSTKPQGQGSGLGLAMVYNTVQSHGGKVVVHSDPGQGTELRILLPATRATPAPRPVARDEASTPTGAGELILVVDDELHLRQMAQRLLEGLGYRVVLAESGEEAVALYRQRCEEIALVILDVVLAGMSGAETLELLRRENPQVKVLVSSGYRQKDQPQTLLDRGANGFLKKPYGIQEFSRAVRQHIDT